MFQRVAVSAVANACKKVPADSSHFVGDSIPTLCILLQSEDKTVLLFPHLTEFLFCMYTLLCFVSKWCNHNGECCNLLDKHRGILAIQLIFLTSCHQGIIEKVLPRVHIATSLPTYVLLQGMKKVRPRFLLRRICMCAWLHDSLKIERKCFLIDVYLLET
jgi:hypothetical protein